MIRIFLVPLLLLMIFTSAGFAQTDKLIGTWQGTLKTPSGIELRIVFNINDNGNGSLITTADSPDQAAYGFKCDTTTINNNTVFINISIFNAFFTGTLISDSVIEGTFKQGMETALVLKKTEKVTEKVRPQTPQPPFSYKTEDVLYTNRDKSLSYGATITIPEGKGSFPAALLITGSGAQDRDETIMGHKLFAVLADHLTRKGFIVLRVDDRGVGISTGQFNEATSEDFAYDVSNSIDYLLSRPEVDKKKIGLIGHSEGGMIAPMVAIKRKDINFIVLMAAPGIRIIDLMAEQNEAVARSSGASEEVQKEIKPLFKRVVSAIIAAPDSVSAYANVSMLTENWAAGKSKELLAEMDFGTVKQRNDYIIEMVKEFQSPWFRYFLKFDPTSYLEQLDCKVLAINGEKDIQVISGSNLSGIERALKKSRSKVYEVKELPGLNHLFQSCKTCTVNEYGELEETISPVALQTISNWLEKHNK